MTTIFLKLSNIDVFELLQNPEVLRNKIDETVALVDTDKPIPWVGAGKQYLSLFD